MDRTRRFQDLPALILQSLANYVFQPRYMLQSRSDWDLINRASLISLMSTCRAMRETVLPMMLSDCRVFIERCAIETSPERVLAKEASVRLQMGAGHLPIPTNMLPLYFGYVRGLEVVVEGFALADGSALALLSGSPLGAAYLTNVTHGKLRIVFGSEDYTGNHQAAQNVHAFLLKLGSTIPHVQSTRALVRHGGRYQNCVHHGSLDLLAQRLFGLLPETGCTSVSLPALPYIGNKLVLQTLTSIGCQWGANYHQCAQLISRSADALTNLHISVCHPDGLQLLFSKEDGSDITYPCLKWFTLRNHGDPTATHAPIQIQTTPFPIVEDLLLDIFPFSNDNIFRNVRALRRLHICPDAQTMHMLNQRRTFTRERFPSLRLAYITTVVDDGDNDSILESYVSSVAQMLHFVRHVLICDADIATRLPAYLAENNVATQLRKLDLIHCNIGLKSLLGLLQMLPTLQRLDCPVNELGEDSESVDALSLASNMRAVFNLQHSQLATWRITNDDTLSQKLVALFIMVVADMCPLFGSVIFDTACKRGSGIVNIILGSKLYASMQDRIVPVDAIGNSPPMIYIRRGFGALSDYTSQQDDYPRLRQTTLSRAKVGLQAGSVAACQARLVGC